MAEAGRSSEDSDENPRVSADDCRTRISQDSTDDSTLGDSASQTGRHETI